MKNILLTLVLVVAIVGISVFSTYAVRRDQIAARRAAVDQAWQQVNQAMLSRNDMVPAVLSAVRGTVARHHAVAEQVRQASSDLLAAATPQDAISASRHLDTAMAELYTDSQDDPDLLVNHRFFVLQDKWAAATNRIAAEQVKFDRTVRDYNDFISVFPNAVFARWASYSTLDDYFSAPPKTAARAAAVFAN